MKARGRDINIFSLSLMDVISGAMGAFLIIMVILAQYYESDPKTSEDADELRRRLDAAIAGLAEIRAGTEEIFAELINSDRGAATGGLSGAISAADIGALGRGVAEDVDRVASHLANVHEDLNAMERDLQEKSAQVSRLQEQQAKLQNRRALVVAASWECSANVDLFVESDRTFVSTDKRGVFFDPRARRQQNFAGDISSDTMNAGAEMSLVSETPLATTYKIYVNLLNAPDTAECRVITHAMGYGAFFAVMPTTTLSAAAPFDYLGSIGVGEGADLEFSFEAPSDNERDAELSAVRKRVASTPPPEPEMKP